MKNEEQSPKIISYNFNAPIGNFFEHVDAVYIGDSPSEQQKLFPQLPSTEQMQKAVEATVAQGYWWASRAWAVVYRVWQMKGYMKSYAEFAREVGEWGLKTGFDCSYDAIQKPIASGVFSGMPEKWISQGATGQAVKLAEALLNELNNLS